MTDTTSITAATIAPETHMGAAHLKVADLERSVRFYTDVLGFRVLDSQGTDSATLTADGATPLLALSVPTDAQPKPPRTTGLYHVAILTPSRAALARTVRRLAETRYPLGGVADHGVSEALYLSDPDDNGLEIYRDRPRAEWQFVNGALTMTTDPLDVDALLAEGLADPRPWDGLEPETRVGHMHLQVSDLDAAVVFYHDVLGFDLMARYGPSAAFLSAGGYHHHLGLNTWGTRHAPSAPANSVGLRQFDILVPNAAELARIATRLRDADITFDQSADALTVHDPSGNLARVIVE